MARHMPNPLLYFHRVLEEYFQAVSSGLPHWASSGEVDIQKAPWGHLERRWPQPLTEKELPFTKPWYLPESKQKSRGSCLMAMVWKAAWCGGRRGPWGPMVGTPCSVYRGSMSSCLNPWGGTATNGSDICRWYGGRLSRGRLLLLLVAAWGKNWVFPWLSDGGKGRHGSDICRWNLQVVGKENVIMSLFWNTAYKVTKWKTWSACLCSGVKLLASWLMGAQGTAKDGLWLWTGSACCLGDPALAVKDCCKCTGCGPWVGLATWGWGGGVCSLSGWVTAMPVVPQGETGVEGGVNGLNPGVGFLSQALWMKWHTVRNTLDHRGIINKLCFWLSWSWSITNRMSHCVPVAVKALLSVGHGTPVLATGRKLFGGSQLSLDLGWWRAMKHHYIGGDM